MQVASLEILENRIEVLQEQKSHLELSWEKFREDNGWITDFIREDLHQDDRKALADIVENYLTEIQYRRNDIDFRKQFYSDIEFFIDSEKKELYQTYRDMSVNIEIERLELQETIQDTESQKAARTDILRTHIADNALERRQNIQQRIESILRERLDNYIANDTFNELSPERKTLVFWKILWRIQMKQSELETSGIKTTVVLDRIETYKVVESIMKEYISKWK